MLNRICVAAAALVMTAAVGNEASAQNPLLLNRGGWSTGHQMNVMPTGGCVNGACGVVQPIRCVPGVGCTTNSQTICTPTGCYATPVNYQTYWNQGVRYAPVNGSGCRNGNCNPNGATWSYPTNWHQNGNGTYWVPVTPAINSQPVVAPKKFVPQPYLTGPTNQPGSLSRDPFFP